MLQCSQPSQRPAGSSPGWISAATKLVGPLRRNCTGSKPNRFPRGRIPLTPRVVAAGASSRTMKIETLSVDFTDEQKRYLEGFATGFQISRAGRGLGGAA